MALSPVLFREGADRTVPGSPISPNVESLLREFDNTPIVREPPMVPTGTFVVADKVSDDEFLMQRLGMAPSSAAPVSSAVAPPALPAPAMASDHSHQHSMLQRPMPQQEKPPEKLTPEQEYSRKVELLWYLRKLRSAAEGPLTVTMNSPLYQIEAEVAQLRKEQMLEDGLESCKFGFLFCTSLIEKATVQPPLNRFGINLQGWSKKLMLDLEVDRRYAQVFTELVEKYRSKVPAGPEATLLYLMVSSAFTYSMASKLTDAALANMTSMPQTMKAAAAHIQQTNPNFSAPPPPPVVSLPQQQTHHTMPASTSLPQGVDPAQMANILRLLQEKKQQSNMPPLPKKERSRSGKSDSGSSGSYASSVSSSSGSSGRSSSSSARSPSSGSYSSESSGRSSSSGSGSGSGSSASDSSSYASSSSSEERSRRKRKVPAKKNVVSKKRRRQEESESESDGTSDSSSEGSVREAELIRRSLPKHTKNARRTSVTNVPVVDVALGSGVSGPVNPILQAAKPVRGRAVRGRRGGRGAAGGVRGRIAATQEARDEAASEKAASEKAPSTRGSVKGPDDDDDDELDMTGF